MMRRLTCQPKALFLIAREDVFQALAELEDEPSSFCIYVSDGEDSDTMAGLHLDAGALMLTVQPRGHKWMSLVFKTPKRIQKAQARAMTPPCFQKTKTFNLAGEPMNGEAYSWGCGK